MERNEDSRQAKKLQYARPHLVRFGDVHVLTNVSGTQNAMDGVTSNKTTA